MITEKINYNVSSLILIMENTHHTDSKSVRKLAVPAFSIGHTIQYACLRRATHHKCWPKVQENEFRSKIYEAGGNSKWIFFNTESVLEKLR